MTRIEFLLAEFTRETDTARKHLERLPTEQFEWRPHARSFTAGALGSHMIDCIRFVEPIFGADELDMDPADYKPFQATSVAAVLETFDREVARAKEVIASAADTTAMQP